MSFYMDFFLRKNHSRGSMCCDISKYSNFLFRFCFLFLARFSIKQNQYYVMSKMTTNDTRFSSIDLCIYEYSILLSASFLSGLS